VTLGDTLHRPRLYAGVGVLTGATLILELTLTRIFSVVMYYHFAFLAISLALFGLGFSGVYLYLRPKLLDRTRFIALLNRYSLAAALAVAVALTVVLRAEVGLLMGQRNLLLVTAIYIGAALPFFFAGLCVSLSVKTLQADMGRLYFWDLAGAGLGCLVLVPLLDLLGGPGTVLFAGVLCLAANLLFGLAEKRPSRSLLRWAPPVVLMLGFAAATVVETTSPFLSLPSVKGTQERNVIFSAWNSFSRVTVERTRTDHLWLKMDSSAATRIFSGELEQQGWRPTQRFSETRVASLVYRLQRPGTALIIGPGGGADVIAALLFGQQHVLGVELNPIIVEDVMRDVFREYSGALYERPDVEVVVDEGRSFIRGSNRRFSSIQATLVDTWAATAAGAFTLSENNLYTREAFVEYLEHLTDDGVLTMTRWKNQAPREFLRLLVLGRAALDDLGVTDHASHFYVAADRRMATFLLKRTPFTREEVALLDAAVREGKLGRLFSPLAQDHNAYAEFIRAADWPGFVERHGVDISPPPDDRPFFFYTIKPGSLGELFTQASRLPKDNLGLLLLIILLGVVFVLVLIFILAPLLIFRRDVLRESRGLKLRYLAYFMALGAGFITVEIALMQKFVLFLGHPVYALTVSLFSLLVFSGVGSFLVRDAPRDRLQRIALRNLALLAGVLVAYLFALSPLFDALAALPTIVRALIAVIFIAPLGLLMGGFLPLGIRDAGERFGELVPWAWGMNGAASVLGSVLTIALAMNLGFNLTLVVGLGFYLLGFLAWRPGAGRSG